MLRIEAIAHGGMRPGGLGRQCAPRMEVVSGRSRTGKRPFPLIAPVAADEHPAFGSLVRIAAAHHVDVYGRLALDAVVDALQPVVEPTLLECLEIDGRIGRELRLSGEVGFRTTVSPRANDEALQAVLVG